MKRSRKQLYILNNRQEMVYFDRHILQEKIEETVNRSSVFDEQLAENISYAIEKYLETLQENGEAVKTIQDIDDFVTNLLSDAGYDEISQHYRQMHGCLSVQNNSQEFQEFSPERIRQVLTSNPLFQSYDIEKLLELVMGSCQRLEMPLISDNFITEIANHVISNNLFAGAEDNQRSRNLLSANEIINFFPEELHELCHENVILARDVTKIFPQIHLDFSFWLYMEFQEKEDPMALFELIFFPSITNFAHKIGETLQDIRHFLAEKYPEIQPSFLLAVDRIEEMIEQKFAFRGKQKLEFRNELQGLFITAVLKYCPDNIDIVFYKDNKNSLN